VNFGIVNQWYPPETGGGGVATYNVNLAHELSSLGHRVVVVSSTHDRKPRLEFDKNIPVYRIPTPCIPSALDRHLPVFGPYMRTFRALLYAWGVRKVLPAIVKEHQLDVLEYADSAAEAFFHNKKKLPPYGIRLHGPLFSIEPYYRGKETPYDIKYFKQMEKKAIIRADILTSPTWAFGEVVRKEYDMDPDRIQTIPHFFNADNCQWFQNHHEKPGLTILFVGRLEYKKGADIFANVIPLIDKKWPQTRYVYLAWDRPQPDGSSTKASLQSILHQAGVLDKVSFLTAPEVNGCIYAALKPDICVVPSRFEAFSYPCLESMAHGVPVVASRICGIPEVVDDAVTGLLFDVGDVQGFADALDKLIQNSSMRSRLGKAAIERANSDLFSPKMIAEKTIKIYEDLLKSQPD